MLRLTPALLALAPLALVPALPAAADEFTDTLESALEAYGAGDIAAAREDLDYAGKLLTAMKSEALAKLLPAPLPGWIREEASEEEAAAGGFMGMLGGGTSASASYRKGTDTATITLVADSPMVSGLGAMISGMAGLGGGKLHRIQRTEFTENEGALQGLVADKVMVSVSGNASVEDKTAYLEAMDFKALAAF